MPTQKELNAFQKKAADETAEGVEKTSGSRLLDLLAVLQDIINPKEKKKKK
jgi:hypothetical protein